MFIITCFFPNITDLPLNQRAWHMAYVIHPRNWRGPMSTLVHGRLNGKTYYFVYRKFSFYLRYFVWVCYKQYVNSCGSFYGGQFLVHLWANLLSNKPRSLFLLYRQNVNVSSRRRKTTQTNMEVVTALLSAVTKFPLTNILFLFYTCSLS